MQGKSLQEITWGPRDGAQTAEADGGDSSRLVRGDHGHVDATDTHILVAGVRPRCVYMVVVVVCVYCVRACVRVCVCVYVRIFVYAVSRCAKETRY